MDSPLLLRQLTSIKRKIVAAFPESCQTKIRAVRKRILIGRPASDRVLASFSPPPRRDHFARSRTAVFQSQRPGLVPVDVGSAALRHPFFRVDRIRAVRPLEATFRLADPQPFLKAAEDGIAAR